MVKHISLQNRNEHPRGWSTDIGHQRKIKSYEVETQWYQKWNEQCGVSARTAKFIGWFSQGEEQWIVLEDLDSEFPVRKQHLNLSEVKTCLQWLAQFHATFMGHNTRRTVGGWHVLAPGYATRRI